MIKKVMIATLLLVLTVVVGAETKIIPLPEMNNPELIFLDDTQMYFTEKASIYIYSLKDYKLIKKFGKEGEGPKEFMFHPRMGGLFLDVKTKDIVANSFCKVSWFTKDGEYIKEIKLRHPLTLYMQPFGKNYIGNFLAWGTERWRILKLYDDQLNELKEIVKMPISSQPGKGTHFLERLPATLVHENRLYLAWEDDFAIKVLDTDLKELYTIRLDEEKIKVTEEYKQILINHLKTAPESRDYFETMKPFYFPEYFPPLFYIFGTGNELYVVTFKLNEEKHHECIIMGVDGKVTKRTFLPIKMSTPFSPYPYVLRNGALYQVVEDGKKEEWAVHITPFK